MPAISDTFQDWQYLGTQNRKIYFAFSAQGNRILTGEADSFHEEERDSMIYFEDDKLTIRNMETADAETIEICRGE